MFRPPTINKSKLIYASAFILLALTAITCTWLISSHLPNKAKRLLVQTLYNAGFQDIKIGSQEHNFKKLVFKNIELDPHRLSTVDKLVISYSWPQLILFNKSESLEISGLKLTGDIDKNGYLSIAGNSNSAAFLNLRNQIHSYRNIKISNSSASILSSNYGGISISLELQAHQNKDSTHFQGALTNTQKQMRYESSFNGQINPEGTYNIGLTLNDINLNTKHLKAARANGETKIIKSANQPPKISGEIRAGNITILGMPWTNAAITLQGNPLKPNAIIGAKATGSENLELGLSFENIYETSILSGYIYTQSISDFLDYLHNNEIILLDYDNDLNLSNGTPLEISFEKNSNIWKADILENNLTQPLTIYLTSKTDDKNTHKISRIHIKNTRPGILKITDDKFLKSIKTDDNSKSQIVLALKNLNYTELSIEKNFDAEENFTFNITGNSPEIEDSRPFKIEFSSSLDANKLIKSLLSDKNNIK